MLTPCTKQQAGRPRAHHFLTTRASAPSSLCMRCAKAARNIARFVVTREWGRAVLVNTAKAPVAGLAGARALVRNTTRNSKNSSGKGHNDGHLNGDSRQSSWKGSMRNPLRRNTSHNVRLPVAVGCFRHCSARLRCATSMSGNGSRCTAVSAAPPLQ